MATNTKTIPVAVAAAPINGIMQAPIGQDIIINSVNNDFVEEAAVTAAMLSRYQAVPNRNDPAQTPTPTRKQIAFMRSLKLKHFFIAFHIPSMQSRLAPTSYLS